MLRGLRVYVYEDVPVGRDMATPRDYKYGAEELFPRLLRGSRFVTRDPARATFFFLPLRCVAYRYAVRDRDEGQAVAERTVRDFVAHVARRHPWWNATQGADHFYLCAHDMGASCARRAHPGLRSNAVALVNTADYADTDFSPHKDIALPPHVGDGCATCTQGSRGRDASALRSARPGARTRLAFFAGNLGRGRVRPAVYERWRADPDMHIVHGAMAVGDYQRNLLTSRFCLFLRGHRAWSPRLMDAVWFGCVPVIISDHYALPLQGLVDWSQFAVILPEARIEHLGAVLRGISASRLVAMQGRLERVRGRFVWNQPPQPLDAFHSVLLSLWRRRHVVRYG